MLTPVLSARWIIGAVVVTSVSTSALITVADEDDAPPVLTAVEASAYENDVAGEVHVVSQENATLTPEADVRLEGAAAGIRRNRGSVSDQSGAARKRFVADEVAPAGIDYGDAEIERRVCRVTAYCDRGTTAAGVPSGIGQCAAPADIPFGSRIYVPALDRTFIVTDRTAKRFRLNTVDLFMPVKRDCKQFGCQYLEVIVTIPDNPPEYASPLLAKEIATVRR